MPSPTDLPTYRDILDYLVDYQRGNPSAYVQRHARRALVEALRVVTNGHQWSYFTGLGRINTMTPYTTGTVVYDHSGGAYERLATLTDGTWPTWVAYGQLVINNVQYTVAERRSATEIQLSIYQNPGEDITEATQYGLYRDTYTLPVDCATVDEIFPINSTTKVRYAHPREWLSAHRYNSSSANSPSLYTITGDPDFQGQLAIRFYPYPDSNYPMDFIYQRRPRSNNVEGIYAGTVTVSEGNTSIAGEGTSWDDSLVGSLLRFSKNGQELPTGLDGGNPYKMERMVMEVTDEQNLVIDQPSAWSLAGVKYMISDPIDIEPGAMQTVYLRCCESQLAKIARFPDRDKIEMDYQLALEEAKMADSRNTTPRHVGGQGGYRTRLADMPAGADVD